MKRKKKNKFPAKYVLLIMSLFCLVIIGCSVSLSYSSAAANTAVGYVIIPMQKGINRVGKALTNLRESFVSKAELQQENEELRTKLADVTDELNQVQLDQDEYQQLKDLYNMDQAFSDYDKVAASVIGKDSGNWFSTFLIDKGTNDGVQTDMNVIADGALAGIVIDAGPNYSTVRAVIDDNTNISCKDLTTSDLCIVSGSLKTMNESSLIVFSGLSDKDDQTKAGDELVTSNISDLYLEGIPVGYITDITADTNNLTKSGKVATIVDFAHLEKVFVILQTKADAIENEGE